MKKFKSIFGPRKLLIWLFVLLMIVTIPEITKPAMSQTEAIVTLLCVDKIDENFEVAASVLTPADGKKPNYVFYYANGQTLGEAMDNVSLSIGKEMGFSQCEVMAFGDNLSEQGVISALDFMVRLKKISNNAVLINFGGTTKDFSKAIYKLFIEKQLKIEQIINSDKKYILSNHTSIDNFYRGYFSPISVAVLPKLTVKTEKTDNAIQVASSGENSEQASDTKGSEMQQKEELYLLNDGTMGVFKKGKKQFELDFATVQKINLFVNKDYQGLLNILDVTDNVYDHATVVMNITKTRPKIKVDFKNGKPSYTLDLNLVMYIEEIVQKEQSSTFMRRNKEFYTSTLLEKIKQKVNDQLNDAAQFCKTNNVDLINVYQNFNCFKNKQFKEYLNKVGKQNYLQDVDFNFNVTIESAY